MNHLLAGQRLVNMTLAAFAGRNASTHFRTGVAVALGQSPVVPSAEYPLPYGPGAGIMSVASILIGLQASRKDGRGVTSREFLNPLDIQPNEVHATQADGGAWASGMVDFAVVRMSDFADVDDSIDAGARSEAFYAGVIGALKAAGRFLDRRSPEVTAHMRGEGLSLRLFVDVRMDQDQMEVEFPPEFLAACGRHKLGVYLISNDIPAEEVLAARSASK